MNRTVRCEWVDIDDHRCNGVADVFYRDPSGRVHWYCPRHRDEQFREQYIDEEV